MNTTVSHWPTEDKQAVHDYLMERYAPLNPVKVAIVGSHAWGTPTDKSDLDIIIYVEDGTEYPKEKEGFYRDDTLWVVGFEPISRFLRLWSLANLHLGVYDLTLDTYHPGNVEDEAFWVQVQKGERTLHDDR